METLVTTGDAEGPLTAADSGQSTADGPSRRGAALAFAGAILVGAFLLFQVQPLVSKAILPWFGGAPAVWSTCMLFFQVLLLAGYCYAHLVQQRFGPRTQAAMQMVLVLAALAMLPILPGPSWKPTDSSGPTWRILALLTVTVGLPYFVLSTTSPLVQVWFSRRWPGRSPYRLYALSNFGSLVALLSYPLVFEPALELPAQAWLWSGGFALYGCLIGGCAIVAGTLRAAPDGRGEERADGTRSVPATRWHWVLWLVLPAIASLVLLATTNHVCQDVAVVPLLWVVPLALYLVSFIICFDHQRWYVRSLWAGLTAVLIPVAACADQLAPWFNYDLGFVEQLGLYFSTMFAIAMLCHGELVRLRPDPRGLTAFYLMIAAGGAIGGAAVSLVAPLVFSTYLEWPIGLVAGYLLALAVLVLARQSPGVRTGYNLAAILVPPIVVIGVLYWQAGRGGPLESCRNFYGTVSVWEDDGDDAESRQRLLKHGRIIHGHQYVEPPRSRQGTMYYQEHSGAARAIAWAGRRGPVRVGEKMGTGSEPKCDNSEKMPSGEVPVPIFSQGVRVGVVGLGIGTLALYARPGDQYRLYEINPEVERLARQYFTYLSDAAERGAVCEVVLGDARLSLENEPPQRFDVLVLDAFSGDSIPTHLLTREAFEIYRGHLAPGGILAVHITNRSLDLAPVVRGLARHFGWEITRVYIQGADTGIFCRSDWMLLSEDRRLPEAIPPSPPPGECDDREVPLWTDHYSNLFQILRGW